MYCFECKYQTPNGECYIGQIEHCPLEKNKWTTFWWIIDDEESELCGEEFFTELENAGREEHNNYVLQIFPNENPRCLGQVTEEEAEIMGLDTY